MLAETSPLFAAAALFGLSTYFGLIPIYRLIQMHEARHELRQGSASQLRRAGGWVVVALWLATVMWCAVFLGDWWATGDYIAASDRAWLRIGLLAKLAASVGGMR